jgi:hypothetical protein
VLLKVTFYGMSDGFAGKEILKEEGGKRLAFFYHCWAADSL